MGPVQQGEVRTASVGCATPMHRGACSPERLPGFGYSRGHPSEELSACKRGPGSLSLLKLEGNRGGGGRPPLGLTPVLLLPLPVVCFPRAPSTSGLQASPGGTLGRAVGPASPRLGTQNWFCSLFSFKQTGTWLLPFEATMGRSPQRPVPPAAREIALRCLPDAPFGV